MDELLQSLFSKKLLHLAPLDDTAACLRRAKGLIDTDMYSALLLNVVASEIYSPYALKYHLGKISNHEDVVSTRANGLKALELEPHNEGKVYFHLSLCCPYVEGLVDTMSSGAWVGPN